MKPPNEVVLAKVDFELFIRQPILKSVEKIFSDSLLKIAQVKIDQMRHRDLSRECDLI